MKHYYISASVVTGKFSVIMSKGEPGPVRVSLGLVGVLDGDVALVVGQPWGCADDVPGQERRHHHGVPEGHGGAVGELDLVRCDLLERDAGQRGDALLLQEHLQEFLAAGQAADAELADERLGGTKVSVTWLRSSALRSWCEVLNRNS